MSNENSINYRQVGDYNIPNLILTPEEAKIRLGKWGMLHKVYLEKHNRTLFNLYLPKVSFISIVQRLKSRHNRCLILLLSS